MVWCASWKPEEMKKDFMVRETDNTCHYILLQHWGSSIVPRKWKEKKIIFALQSNRTASVFKMSNLRDDRINSNCVILLLFPNRFNRFCHMSVRFSTQIQFSFNSVCFKLLFFLFACHVLCVVFVVKNKYPPLCQTVHSSAAIIFSHLLFVRLRIVFFASW